MLDRIGGLQERELALAAHRESGAAEAQVALEYIPSFSEPVHLMGAMIGQKRCGNPRRPTS